MPVSLSGVDSQCVVWVARVAIGGEVGEGRGPGRVAWRKVMRTAATAVGKSVGKSNTPLGAWISSSATV